MELILKEINRALESGLYYLAVANSLTLPDMCAALESADGKTSGPLYKAWCDRWLDLDVTSLPSTEMWCLRNGVLHQGIFGHDRLVYSRVVFTIPGSAAEGFHNIVMKYADDDPSLTNPLDTLRAAGRSPFFVRADLFCGWVIGGVEAWYEDKQNDPTVQVNLPRLLQLRPNGLLPYVSGCPIIG